MSFLNRIKERARADIKTIALPETSDPRTLAAAALALDEGIAEIVLIGAKDDILTCADGRGLERAIIIDPRGYEKMDELSNSLYELRKDKGMTLDEASSLLKNDPLFLGNMLVKAGVADGMVAGAVNSTANVLRPAFQIIKTAPGVRLVSAFFLMVVPDCEYGADGVFIFADSGNVQNPNAEELAAIAVSSAQSFKLLVGVDPVVAMLSHSTKGSARHADVEKVVEATRLAKLMAPYLLIDGEFQADAAIVPSVGEKKAPGSPVAGKANVLVFPDLDAGNIGYKLTERLAKAEAYGPITQGIRKPVNDLSRGCTAEDIAGVIAITSVQAQNNLMEDGAR